MSDLQHITRSAQTHTHTYTHSYYTTLYWAQTWVREKTKGSIVRIWMQMESPCCLSGAFFSLNSGQEGRQTEEKTGRLPTLPTSPRAAQYSRLWKWARPDDPSALIAYSEGCECARWMLINKGECEQWRRDMLETWRSALRETSRGWQGEKNSLCGLTEEDMQQWMLTNGFPSG